MSVLEDKSDQTDGAEANEEAAWRCVGTWWQSADGRDTKALWVEGVAASWT